MHLSRKWKETNEGALGSPTMLGLFIRELLLNSFFRFGLRILWKPEFGLWHLIYPCFVIKFSQNLHLKSIWSWKCQLKACRWIQKPVQNHQTQDQRVRASLKSWENQSKEKIRARHGIYNIPSTLIFWAEKGSLHIRNKSAYHLL